MPPGENWGPMRRGLGPSVDLRRLFAKCPIDLWNDLVVRLEQRGIEGGHIALVVQNRAKYPFEILRPRSAVERGLQRSPAGALRIPAEPYSCQLLLECRVVVLATHERVAVRRDLGPEAPERLGGQLPMLRTFAPLLPQSAELSRQTTNLSNSEDSHTL